MLPIALINSSLILVFSLFSFFRKRPVWNQIVFYILLDHLILFRDKKKLALHSTWVWNDAFVSGHTCLRGPRGRPDDVLGMHSFNIPLHKNSITDAIFSKIRLFQRICKGDAGCFSFELNQIFEKYRFIVNHDSWASDRPIRLVQNLFLWPWNGLICRI